MALSLLSPPPPSLASRHPTPSNSTSTTKTMASTTSSSTTKTMASTTSSSTTKTMASTTSTSSSPPKHIVVCGGGVIGACTTFFLSPAAASLSSPATPTANVTLVEKSSVACAASGKAGGFLALDWCDGGPLSSLARSSFSLHRSLAQTLGGPHHYGYRPLETLSLSVLSGDDDDDSGRRRKKANKSSSSLLPQWVDGPARHPKRIGTTNTTAQVHPQLFTQRLVEAAVESGGVEVVKGEVQHVNMDGDQAVGVSVRTESGEVTSIPADAVVLALGPWSNCLPLVSSLFTVSGLKAHSIVLRPSDPNAITPHALFLSYLPDGGGKALQPEVYPRPTGEVYICGMSKDEEVPADPKQIFGDPQSIAMLHEIAGTVSTQLATNSSSGGATASVVAEQACFLPCTDDGLPVIGELPRARGCYVGTGHSCWGILNGPATGASLAELIMNGHTTSVDLTPFSPSRFLRFRSR